MAITQDNRILRFTITGLPDDHLLIRRFTATEAMSQLYSIRVDLQHEEADRSPEPTIVEAKDVLGKAANIEITQSDGTSRNFNGIINRFSQGNRDERFTFYRAEIVPKLWLLTQVTQSRIFQHKSVPQILEEVLQGFEVSWQIQGTFEPRNYCVQYRETDFAFASRLMEEEGIYYYFKHTADSHEMVVANTPQSHDDCPSASEIEFAEKVGGEGFQSSITSIATNYQLQTSEVAFWDYHFQKPDSHLEASRTSQFEELKSQKLELYDYPGGYARRFDGIDKGGNERPNDIQHLFEDNERHTALSLQALDARFKTLAGGGECSGMMAGHKFKLKSHPSAAMNAPYVITSVEHSGVQSPDYDSNEMISGPYKNTFTCLPLEVPFRPPRTTPKPLVRGSQTAVVVGPSGEEIFTDKYGRIKVQFHWDRQGKFDPDSSCWVRVGKDIAGNKWGTFYLPRIGQEVMVDFLEGDPDQPIVVGSVYNALTMPHYELPKFKTLSYIHTKTSPDDGKGYNTLRFEDKKDKEQVFMRSQKRYDLRVRGSMYETCGGSRQEVIGLKQENQPGGNLAVTVAGCYDLHVKENMFIGIDGKLNEAVKGEVVEDYQSSQFTKVATKRSLNAREIIMEAATKISLKVGGSCIVIEPALITIAAAMVKINSGGYGTETGDTAIEDPLDAEVSDNGEPGYLDRPRTGGGRGRNRRTLTSQHHVYPPRPGESAAFTAMRNRLNTSAQGRHALEVFERNGVAVTTNPGGTAYSGNPTNSVNLDPARAADAAPGFVHEMGHAEADHGGTSADVQAQTRADYIDTQLREDAHAERSAYEAEEQMNAAGGSERYNSSTRTTYQNALNAERTRLRAADPNMSDEEVNRRSHDAAEAAILQDYRNGNVNTGNTTPPQSYVNYWGSDYDARHRP